MKIIKLLTPVAVVAASFGTYALLQANKPQPEITDDPPRATAVHVTTAQRSSTSLEVVTQGEVRARTAIELVSQVGGRIIEVSPEFTEGGVIEPDVPLLVIDDTDYQLALDQARARVAEAEVRVQQTLADADVARKQLRGDPSASDLALKKPQVAEARASLEAARANVEQARINLSRTRITLPFHGRVAATRVDVGQYITPGTPIGTAFGTEVVEVRLPLNDSQLASLGLPIGYHPERGAGLPVRLSAKVAGRQQEWRGELTRLDASIDPTTRMLFALVEVHDPYGANVSALEMPLAVGLFVDARVQGKEMSNAFVIPRAALRAGDVVFVIDNEERLRITPVQVAHSSVDRAVISEGLAVGDRIVTSAIRNPIQGMALVALDQPQPRAESAVAGKDH